MIRVLSLVPYPLGRVPGQRYRIEQWAPRLEAEGVRLEFSSFLPEWAMDRLYRPGHLAAKTLATALGYARRVAELVARGKHDVVFVYREAALLGPAWIEALLARRAPLVFDFDDAIFLRAASPANAWVARFKTVGKTEHICRVAAHVTVGNEFLADWARKRASTVSVVPTTIDTDAYTLAERPVNARPVVGWSGSLTTAGYLRDLAPALRRLAERVDFELRVVGAVVSIEGVRVACLPWSAVSEVDDLRPLDVGLMPLSDDEWSRGKCALKALQYMALGIPPVVSPVGANVDVVRDGVNGYHARNEEEWVARIASLLANPALRKRMGLAARRTVEETYSARAQAPRMAAVLRKAAEGGPS